MKHFPNFRPFLIVAILAALLSFAIPAAAGGWAVATLDTLPAQVVAGQPLTVGFVVRQHGVRPLEGLSPAIQLQQEGGKSERIPAQPEGGAGHYTATLTFPSAGVWNWAIETNFWPQYQPLPALTVIANQGEAAAPAKAGAAVSTSSIAMLIGVVGLFGLAGGLFALVRTKTPWAAGVTLIAALISLAGFVFPALQATAYEPAAAIAPVTAEPESQVELGQRLFVAKGCVVCHTHDSVSEVKRLIGFNFDQAPNLTDYSAAPDHVSKWLNNPQAVKSDAYMPNLNLSAAEIDALVAFINAP